MNMGGGWPTLGGQRMKIEEWPNFITVKILQLEAQAKKPRKLNACAMR